jgi:hypothetical protein
MRACFRQYWQLICLIYIDARRRQKIQFKLDIMHLPYALVIKYDGTILIIPQIYNSDGSIHSILLHIMLLVGLTFLITFLFYYALRYILMS